MRSQSGLTRTPANKLLPAASSRASALRVDNRDLLLVAIDGNSSKTRGVWNGSWPCENVGMLRRRRMTFSHPSRVPPPASLALLWSTPQKPR